jgi:hypothetical protein
VSLRTLLKWMGWIYDSEHISCGLRPAPRLDRSIGRQDADTAELALGLDKPGRPALLGGGDMRYLSILAFHPGLNRRRDSWPLKRLATGHAIGGLDKEPLKDINVDEVDYDKFAAASKLAF